MEGGFVYLIQDKDGGYYTGISKDADKRLLEHNSGKLKITAHRRPFHLVYNKLYSSYQEARKHEKWLKKKNKQYKARLSL